MAIRTALSRVQHVGQHILDLVESSLAHRRTKEPDDQLRADHQSHTRYPFQPRF